MPPVFILKLHGVYTVFDVFSPNLYMGKFDALKTHYNIFNKIMSGRSLKVTF